MSSNLDHDEDKDKISQELEELASASVPSKLKGIRACKRCGILKTLDQFLEEGCENCDYLEMRDEIENCRNYTTAFFEGQVAVMDPRDSWVAKWLHVDSYLPGVYAISVTGEFDKKTEERLENRGCRWRCRPHEKTGTAAFN